MDTKNTQQQSETKQVKKDIISRVLLVISIILIILLLLRSCGSEPVDTREPMPGFETTTGNLNDIEHKSQEEILDELRQQVEEGMMNISMNLNPVFPDGESEGNLLISNEEINRHPQIVEIYHKGESRFDGDTPIYVSGVIPVGKEIAYDKLAVDLDAGTYDCVAYFYGIDDDGNILGVAGAEVKLIVQS